VSDGVRDKEIDGSSDGVSDGVLCPDFERKKMKKKSVCTLACFSWRAAAPKLKSLRLPRALSAAVRDSFWGPTWLIGSLQPTGFCD